MYKAEQKYKHKQTTIYMTKFHLQTQREISFDGKTVAALKIDLTTNFLLIEWLFISKTFQL